MKSKEMKQYLTGSGAGYRPTANYLGQMSDTANQNLSQKSGHTGFLEILGVNNLVFGVKDRDNQYAGIEAGHDLGLNAMSEHSNIMMYALVAAALVAVCYFYFKNKK